MAHEEAPQQAGPRRGSVMRSISAIGNSMTKDLHHGMKFDLVHPRRVPLIKSPLKGLEEESHGHGHAAAHEKTPPPPRKQSESSDASDDEIAEKGVSHHLEPELRYHHESPAIQLFYDLFFVANITTFTSQHEVNNSNGKQFKRNARFLLTFSSSSKIICWIFQSFMVHMVSSRLFRC
jgi:hypothetical protein